jgi:hypothetical protein
LPLEGFDLPLFVVPHECLSHGLGAGLGIVSGYGTGILSIGEDHTSRLTLFSTEIIWTVWRDESTFS